MKRIRIGKRFIPFWFVIVLLTSSVGVGLGVSASYLWPHVQVPFEVEEPIEILDYTSDLSLFPGETKYINITVQNHASITYNVTLDFQLSDLDYQVTYVTFSDVIYTVGPGEHNLIAWVKVTHSAPATTSSLTIQIKRVDTNVEFVSFEKLLGKLRFDPGYDVGIYIWVDVEGWHVWWTGDYRITGNLNVVAFNFTTDGNFTDVQTYRWDWEDFLLVNTNNELSGRSGICEDIDGLDFNVAGATKIVLDIKISDSINREIWRTKSYNVKLNTILHTSVHYDTNLIFLGANERASTMRLVVKL